MIGAAPTDLPDCEWWVTAADLTGADGSDVTSWPARVGPALDSTAGGTAPKLDTDAWGGNPGVRFAVGSVLRKVGGITGLLAATPGSTLVVFARHETSTATANLLAVSTATASTTRAALRTTTSGKSYLTAVARRLDGDTAVTMTGSGPLGFSIADTVRPHAIAMTLDHAATTARVALDGIPVNTSSSYLTAGSTSATDPAVLALGCSTSDASSSFVGVIFEAAIFSRALTEGELGQLAQRWISTYGGGLVPDLVPQDVPWRMDLDALHASGRTVIANLFSPGPTSRDNAPAPDVWDTSFVDPAGQSGAYAAIGGYWRTRPARRSPRPESSWWLTDALVLTQWARSIGVSVVGTDFLSRTAENGRHWHFNRVHAMAAALSGIKVVTFLDGTGLQNNWTAAALADVVATIHDYGASWVLPDGRVVVQVDAPEMMALPGSTPVGSSSTGLVTTSSTMTTCMLALRDALQARGIDPAFQFIPIGPGWDRYRSALTTGPAAGLTWSPSWWGAGNPLFSRNAEADARNYGSDGPGGWCQPVRVQDFRPKFRVFDESSGLLHLRTTMEGAIRGGATMAHLITFGDYSENTQIEPSEFQPDGWGRIMSWWLAWFLLGVPPMIERDAVAVINRRAPYAAAPTDSRNTSLMSARSGSTAPQDIVEVCTWLTAPATLKVTVGGELREFAAPAGFSTRTVPLAVGVPTAEVIRAAGSLTVDGIEVAARPLVQDLSYAGRMTVGTLPDLPPPALGDDVVLVRGGRRIRADLITPSGPVRVRATRT